MTASITGCSFCIDGLMPAGRDDFMGELFELCPACRQPCTSCDGIAVFPVSYDDPDDLADDLAAFDLGPIFCPSCTGITALAALRFYPTHHAPEVIMPTPTGPSAFKDPFHDDSPTPLATDDYLTEAITDVQTQLGRVDTKASMLLAGATAALSAGIAVTAKANLGTPATISAVVTITVLAAAVARLFTAIRPALRGNHGFVRFAHTNPADLLADIALTTSGRDTYQAERLQNLSNSVLRKYRAVRTAVDLLRAALACTAVTALLAALL